MLIVLKLIIIPLFTGVDIILLKKLCLEPLMFKRQSEDALQFHFENICN